MSKSGDTLKQLFTETKSESATRLVATALEEVWVSGQWSASSLSEAVTSNAFVAQLASPDPAQTADDADEA